MITQNKIFAFVIENAVSEIDKRAKYL